MEERREDIDSPTSSTTAVGQPEATRKPIREKTPNADGKIVLDEADAMECLGFTFPAWKRWMILSVIFAVQASMNFNASVYPNAVSLISEDFGVSEQAARLGQGLFLIFYALGCELWAPWSEEYGRFWVLQLSLFLVNIWQILFGLAPNFGSIVVARILGGISSAGGSVTLGMVADLYQPDNQQFAVAFVVLSSVGGSVLGPIAGGRMEASLSWHWNAWIQLIFGGVVQILHFLLVPETRTSILLDREAKRRRAAGETNVYGPNEVKASRIPSAKEIGTIWIRPFHMFLTEPIVLCLSLLSGFSDALIFIFLASWTLVFQQWGFGPTEVGLAFFSIFIAYFLAYASFFPFYIRRRKITRQKGPDALPPEERLYWLLWLAPLEAIGLIGFAWTSIGPDYNVPWIAPLLFAALIGIANYAIYAATIDYMIEAYGEYSASATGGNGFSRDFLAGIAAFYATPMYENIGTTFHLAWASTILAILAAMLIIPVYVIYYKGPTLRARSPFAVSLANERKGRRERTSDKERLLTEKNTASQA